MCDVPTLEQRAAALADVVEAGGRPARAQQLRDNPAEVGEAEFAALAAELGVLPSQLFFAFIFRLAQTTGWRHRALDHARLLEGTLQ